MSFVHETAIIDSDTLGEGAVFGNGFMFVLALR